MKTRDSSRPGSSRRRTVVPKVSPHVTALLRCPPEGQIPPPYRRQRGHIQCDAPAAARPMRQGAGLRAEIRPPRAVTLDIDDTVNVVHGHQQLSLFNGHYDERCFLPIHVSYTATSRPVAMLLHSGATPSGEEVRDHLRRIRRHWPDTRLAMRGDGHYGRPEVSDEIARHETASAGRAINHTMAR